MFEKKMYINGNLVGNSKQYDIFCPANNKRIGSVAWATEKETHQALEAANEAFDSWSNTTVQERIGWMIKLRNEVTANSDHLRECIHLEMGKPWSATQEDIDSLVNSLTFYAEEIQKRKPELLSDKDGTHSHILKEESVGVVVAFIAWNFPLLNLAFKIGPAMASGCPIIIKPSYKSPLSAYAVGELCAKIGLPKGAVNIICGDDEVV
jgi:succinate-semialdehyde dehydrogenase/glutarate-semialdehyde dehydrogenase